MGLVNICPQNSCVSLWSELMIFDELGKDDSERLCHDERPDFFGGRPNYIMTRMFNFEEILGSPITHVPFSRK